jgi:hypothetical protein
MAQTTVETTFSLTSGDVVKQSDRVVFETEFSIGSVSPLHPNSCNIEGNFVKDGFKVRLVPYFSGQKVYEGISEVCMPEGEVTKLETEISSGLSVGTHELRVKVKEAKTGNRLAQFKQQVQITTDDYSGGPSGGWYDGGGDTPQESDETVSSGGSSDDSGSQDGSSGGSGGGSTGQPNITVSALGITPDQVSPGDNVEAWVRGQNFGDGSGSKTYTVTLNGQPVRDVTFDLSAGGSRDATFNVSIPNSDEATLSVEGDDTSFSMNVGPGGAVPGEPGFSRPLTGAPDSVKVGETFTVGAYVSCVSSGTSSCSNVKVSMSVNSQQKRLIEMGDLPPNGGSPLDVTMSFASPGRKDVIFEVNGSARSFTVDVQGSDGETQPGGGGTGQVPETGVEPIDQAIQTAVENPYLAMAGAGAIGVGLTSLSGDDEPRIIRTIRPSRTNRTRNNNRSNR